MDGGAGEVEGEGELVMSSSVPSLPPPSPRSPPQCPDLYGKRRELAKLQMLEREKGFLEEELKFVDGLQPATRCCKEVADFVILKADPLIPTNRKTSRSCGLWKWLCGSSCFSFSWLCCCAGRACHLKMPDCCNCNICDCSCCKGCSLPRCKCSCSPCSCCCAKVSCYPCCCKLKRPSCFSCNCCKCSCSCPKPKDCCPCFNRRKCCCCCCDPTCCICF